MLSGTWRGNTEWRYPDGRVAVTRVEVKASWDAEQCLLKEEYVTQFGDGIPPVRSTGFWAWDPAIGRYRTWHYDTSGKSFDGTASYDPETRRWRLELEVIDHHDGTRLHAMGDLEFESDDTRRFKFRHLNGDGSLDCESRGVWHRANSDTGK